MTQKAVRGTASQVQDVTIMWIMGGHDEQNGLTD
jgi:hypothetical protein